MLQELGVQAQLVTTAARACQSGVRVAGASGRTVEQTLSHLSELCEQAAFATEPSRTAPVPGSVEPAAPEEGAGRFAVRAAELLAAFAGRDPAEPCPTWWPEQHTVGFWMRRLLHATTVHRVDLQLAAGIPVSPIPGDTAVDGIDEVLRVWFEYRLHALGITATRSCSVGVHAAGRSWLVTADQDGAAVVGSADVPAATPDSVVDGDPAAVYLWLWGRLPERAVRTSGDPDATAQLWGLLRLATR
ncbi:maleylpyruvate isomerase N-terminal domain-containing protein [Saccharopolyspora sp. HNM0983]|uniref:Maleylpyruvate isomerase N-terminal domain-containing protein n=2 Tax=Saccharopolyspora montiporae TaxID=2781240 RepID=A0A929FYW0_9PSEU|nr:maleylpyruvate isomerase N-terminal domain-containing protein [Saccharopolyspora sp. HNM0983]MBE9373117.1 maleylpyruvate isomerase N-terminal domain-containing protein [Saccharopolyspora sp. HNM0983]